MRNGKMRNEELGMRNMLFAICSLMILFAACDDGIVPVASGYGRVTISFTETEAAAAQARTVLPATVFNKYVYIFTKTGEDNGTEKNPDGGGFFTLETGDYTVEVRAYTGSAEPYTLAASGTSAPFSVASGSNAAVAVTLSSLIAAGEGEFRFTVTYPAGASAEITLYKWPDMDSIAVSPGSVTGGNGITQTLNLEAGTYLFTAVAGKNGLYGGISEAVHIYPSLATVYAKHFTDNEFLTAPLAGTVSISGDAYAGQTLTADTSGLGGSGTVAYQWKRGTAVVGTNSSAYTLTTDDIGSTITVTVTRSGNYGGITSNATAVVTEPPIYTVSFDANNGSAVTTRQVSHGSTVSEPDAPEREWAAFLGWYTQRTGGIQFDFSTPITSFITLYAHWQYTGSLPITNASDLGIYLAVQSGGTSVETPENLPVNMQLTEQNWLSILSGIAISEKYVNLDLSGCYRSDASEGGGLRTDGTFDPVYSISDGKDRIVSLVLPNAASSMSVESPYANSSVFGRFTNLKSCSGANVTNIGDYAFYNRTSLVSVDFPEATGIEFWAFNNCTSLVSVDFPKVTRIGAAAFGGCTGLTNVKIPSIARFELNAMANSYAFYQTGNATLTITMGQTAPVYVGKCIFGDNPVRTVYVKVPAGATGYGTIPATYSGTSQTVNWGNGFRGAGWMTDKFSSLQPALDINSNITLYVQYQ